MLSVDRLCGLSRSGFFPNGLLGKINRPTGYNLTKYAADTWPKNAAKGFQVLSTAVL